MKKILLSLLLVGSIGSMCTACTTSTPPPHVHNYGNWEIVVKPTCTEDGVREKTCDGCGDKIRESIPKTNHNFVDGICTECGEKEPK